MPERQYLYTFKLARRAASDFTRANGDIAGAAGIQAVWRPSHGNTRVPLDVAGVYPELGDKALRTWVGVGGSPESVVRAARYGFPFTLALIGGSALRFKPYADLYQQSLEQFGHPAQPIAVHSPGHVAATDAEAREELWPHYAAVMTRIGAERGWPPASRRQFDHEAGPDGALYVGSPETVAKEIIRTVRALGLSRFDMKYSNGALPHDSAMKSIELFGTAVAPMIRAEFDRG